MEQNLTITHGMRRISTSKERNAVDDDERVSISDKNVFLQYAHRVSYE